NWTFIAWGTFHALLFLPLILLKKNRKNTDTVAENRILPNLKELFQITVTFLLVVFGLILFRAESIGQSVEYFSGIMDGSLFSVSSIYKKQPLLQNVIFIAIMLAVEWLQRNKQHGLETPKIKSHILKFGIYYLLVFLLFLFAKEGKTFIYFQF
ncbi:MAG: MBOAT family protein, partial [Prevotellaceae bacterium]|nr:MBOAT family protein [Prevotellaceae bacterium]